MNRSQLDIWIEELRQAWERADPPRAAALFTDDAVYHSHPLRAPLVGPTAIEDYWKQATSTQTDVEVRMGRPLLDGSRAVVEWWTLMTEDQRRTTDTGALVLEFEGDRCRNLREYWNTEDEWIEPPPGWGQ